MKHLLPALAAGLLAAFTCLTVEAARLDIALSPDRGNPSSPQMGDHMRFVSVIRNAGDAAAHGLVAWISLVEVDPGHEQPMDLEDWSAHKAVTRATLAPGAQVTVRWPMRLIQAGDYRVVISAVERDTPHIITSPFIDFRVRQKPVVESQRILPVALCVPLVLGGLLAWRLRRRR
jgi:hypothetical protein